MRTGLGGEFREGVEQARLPDATGAVHVQHREGRLRRVEGRAEQLPLAHPPDEPGTSTSRDRVPQGHG
jgi:hypothetical protein